MSQTAPQTAPQLLQRLHSNSESHQPQQKLWTKQDLDKIDKRFYGWKLAAEQIRTDKNKAWNLIKTGDKIYRTGGRSAWGIPNKAKKINQNKSDFQAWWQGMGDGERLSIWPNADMNAMQEYQNEFRHKYNDEYDTEDQTGYAYNEFIRHEHQHPPRYLFGDNIDYHQDDSLVMSMYTTLIGLCLLLIIGCICCIIGGSVTWIISRFSDEERRRSARDGYRTLKVNTNRVIQSDEVCYIDPSIYLHSSLW